MIAATIVAAVTVSLAGLAFAAPAAGDLAPLPSKSPSPTAVPTPDSTAATTAPVTDSGDDDGTATATLVIAGCVVAGVAGVSIYALRRSRQVPPGEDGR